MLKKTLPILAAAFIAQTALAGATLPPTPTITSPADNAENVDTLPTFTSDASGATDWLASYPSSYVQLVGGWAKNAMGQYQDIPFPVEGVTLDGANVSTLRIYYEGKAELLAENGDILARTILNPSTTRYSQPSDLSGVISVSRLSNRIIINWHQKNDGGSVNWDAALQALFLIDGNTQVIKSVGLKSKPNDLNNELFSLSNSEVGCQLRSDGTLKGPINSTLPAYKTELKEHTVPAQTMFSMQCYVQSGWGGVERQPFLYPESPFMNYGKPLVTVTESGTSQATPETALQQFSEYQVQVRARAATGESSVWSTPVGFTTRGPLSDYVFTSLPKNIRTNANSAQNLTFVVKNQGSESGNPEIYLRLPFSAEPIGDAETIPDPETLPGPDTRYNVSASIAGGDCYVFVDDREDATYINCQPNEPLLAQESVIIEASLLLPPGTPSIEYLACERRLCDESTFESLPVTDASSSSSSGGASWLLLLFSFVVSLRRR
ncbi:hypothetical protein [Thalassolituus hydrocarboniclasticus]|uniref:Fibronectin type-III domain-containing protein n=1 Tax=Thalassolituus hydrocarboniclasticus TaxID=2742796 RepID=A0ABY6A462_9GAMM|nr:hypothetical protein [Thalassolituus hydrocarboniclasticus]UXD85942.1 hypothetical protein HUF19_00075 [Thalassolituus hydrocarboniclasticus]